MLLHAVQPQRFLSDVGLPKTTSTTGVNQELPSSSLTHQIFLSTPSSLRACTGLDIFACEEKESLELPLVEGEDVPSAGGVPQAEGVCSCVASPPLLANLSASMLTQQLLEEDSDTFLERSER